VQDFVGLRGESLVVSDPIDGAFARFYQVVGERVVANVDAHDGRISTILLTDNSTSGPEIKITSDQALATGRAFLDDHGFPWQGLRETVELRNHGESNEYVITWEHWEGDVLTPDYRMVGINAATGRVFRYADVQRPYVLPGEPKVARAAALVAAAEASGFGGAGIVTKSELRIVFDYAGAQRLVWWVYLDGPVPGAPDLVAHALVEVDAMTGTATVLGGG
jgi:hypothetical protein